MTSDGLDTLNHGGHLVVRLRGELDAVDAADAEAALARATATNPRVIVDLAALEFLDCCGLGVLIRMRAQAQQDGGDLLLAAPGQQVRRILALTGMTGMTGVFRVHASVDEAVRAAGWPRSRDTPGAPILAADVARHSAMT
jgi:anti-sigma B factor antagonist